MTNIFLLKQFLPKTASNFCEILSPVRKKQERTEKELSGSALGQQTRMQLNSQCFFSNCLFAAKMQNERG
jgi:hypothetical protein